MLDLLPDHGAVSLEQRDPAPVAKFGGVLCGTHDVSEEHGR